MSKKTFERPSQAVVTPTAKDEKVMVQVANVPELKTSTSGDTSKTFVTYEEMLQDNKGHNLPKKIVPLKQERGYLADTSDNDGLLNLAIEDLTYISLAINPKDLENYLLKLNGDRVLKSIRVYNGSKGPYLYAALDKNLAIDRENKTTLLAVLDRRLNQRLKVETITTGPLRSLLITDYRSNIVDKNDDIGFMFDIRQAIAMFISSHVFSTESVIDNTRLQRMISAQFRISEDVLFEGGKILVAFSFVNKANSSLLIKLPQDMVVGLNSSMSLVKFKAKVDKYLQDNVDTSARVEYVNFVKLLRTESVAGISPLETEKAKANQKLISDLAGNSGTSGGITVTQVPLVLLDSAFSQDRQVFHNSTINTLLAPIPSREGVKKELVAKRLGSLLTDDIMSFSVGENTIAILTDIAKLVMTVELGGIKDLRLSVSTTDSHLAYNFTI